MFPVMICLHPSFQNRYQRIVLFLGEHIFFLIAFKNFLRHTHSLLHLLWPLSYQPKLKQTLKKYGKP